jgi:t-SNARE complex subunit (syntaxin)
MEDFDYYYQSLRKRLDKLQASTNALASVPTESINKLLSECESESRRVEIDLEGCESAIQNLDKGPSKTSAEKSYMEAKERYNKYKVEIEFKKNKPQNYGLFGNQEDEKELPKNLGQMSAQQVIDKGDNLYADAENRLQNALGITEQSKQVVGGIEVNIKEQDDQIDRIYDKTQDVRSNLKRANKVMDLIYRRYLTDKCIMMLIIFIIIILIVIIIFGILKAGKISFSSDSIH